MSSERQALVDRKIATEKALIGVCKKLKKRIQKKATIGLILTIGALIAYSLAVKPKRKKLDKKESLKSLNETGTKDSPKSKRGRSFIDKVKNMLLKRIEKKMKNVALRYLHDKIK